MKILFTGSSSFTGYWFANYLIKEGHSVTATFTKNNLDEYDDLRKIRIQHLLNNKVASIFGIAFGSQNFLDLLINNNFDLICHHGAYVSEYKAFSFNVSSAYNNNTHNIVKVLNILQNHNSKVVISGSVFEGGEGIGSGEPLAFSPYGLSKQFTSEAFKYYCNFLTIPLAKFVIPNPFGPFEKERFTSYLVKSWIKGERPIIKTPLYVRDNIHISLLASCYTKFCVDFYNNNLMYFRINPSGYIESQGQFTNRFSEAISKRLNILAPFELSKQTEFSEPLIRINNFPASKYVTNWNEERAWDELAEYYISLYTI